MPTPRFNNGDTVWVTFSDGNPEQKVIDGEPYYQPLTRIYMYSFKGVGYTCGENYLRANLTDKILRISECIQEPDDYVDDGLVSEGIGSDGGLAVEGIRSFSGKHTTIFFRPDNTFINWLVKYANGRVICDVGSGSGHLLNKLADAGGKVLGIEPYWDAEDNLALTKLRLESGKGLINILPRKVEECERFIKSMGDKCILLFCRPCHSDFVETALSYRAEGCEALYITMPDNWTKYNDLGAYRANATLIEHEGWSADREKVWSIK